MCACGHDQALHNPCSVCECPRFAERPPAKKQTYPKRPTK